ncbi:hypothetical protein ACJJTC_018458 [Scirpophaga incertulas]
MQAPRNQLVKETIRKWGAINLQIGREDGSVRIPPADKFEDPVNFITQLRRRMANLQPVPACRHSESASFVFKDLAVSLHGFLLDDAVRRPLQHPYTGPRRVIDRIR